MTLGGTSEKRPLEGPAHAALEALIEAIAERVADKVAVRVGAATPRYADGKNNPLGSERAFFKAVEIGAFPTFKRGRLVSALWSDVERYTESRKLPPRRPLEDTADADREELIAAGARLRSGKGLRR